MTTKLEAVNVILAGVGEAKVLSLGDGFVTADNAQTTLDQVSYQVQEMGWHFNTELGFKLYPDVNGHILLPDNLLRLDASRQGVTKRGGKLYDLKNHTFKFSKPVQVDAVLALDFADLPEAAKQFIMLRAKRIFQADFLGDPNLYQMQSPDEQRALVNLKQMDSEGADYNIFDNAEFAETLRRDLT